MLILVVPVLSDRSIKVHVVTAGRGHATTNCSLKFDRRRSLTIQIQENLPTFGKLSEIICFSDTPVAVLVAEAPFSFAYKFILRFTICTSIALLLCFPEENDRTQGKTKCQRARERRLQRRKTRSTVFVPKCKANGQFRATQCHKRTKTCWCVYEDGKEIPETRVKKPERPNCKLSK